MENIPRFFSTPLSKFAGACPGPAGKGGSHFNFRSIAVQKSTGDPLSGSAPGVGTYSSTGFQQTGSVREKQFFSMNPVATKGCYGVRNRRSIRCYTCLEIFWIICRVQEVPSIYNNGVECPGVRKTFHIMVGSLWVTVCQVPAHGCIIIAGTLCKADEQACHEEGNAHKGEDGFPVGCSLLGSGWGCCRVCRHHSFLFCPHHSGRSRDGCIRDDRVQG